MKLIISYFPPLCIFLLQHLPLLSDKELISRDAEQGDLHIAEFAQ